MMENLLIYRDPQFGIFALAKTAIAMGFDIQRVVLGFITVFQVSVGKHTVGGRAGLGFQVKAPRIFLYVTIRIDEYAMRYQEATHDLFAILVPKPVAKFFMKWVIFTESPADRGVTQAVEGLGAVFNRTERLEHDSLCVFGDGLFAMDA